MAVSFLGIARVKGKSMEGTVSDGDYLLLSSKAYKIKKPCRGDIVVVNSSLKDEKGEDKKLLKRVIGLPGEKIIISGGEVFIDGIRLDEDYVNGKIPMKDRMEMEIPPDSLFLMGDNRAYSLDSRSPEVGALKIKDVCGRAVARIWPPHKGKIFRHEER